MTDSAPPSARVRVDAQRNRTRLIEVARSAFAAGTHPTAAPVSLDAIAREAGVGIGTLYRHFPTRETLIEAVYRTELDGVLAQASVLLRDHDPVAALRSWMDAYAAFVTTKRGMAESLRSLLQAGTITSAQTRQRVTDTIQAFLDAGVQAGSLRADVRADDIAASLVGVFLATPDPAQSDQAGRMLDLLVAGIRSDHCRLGVAPDLRFLVLAAGSASSLARILRAALTSSSGRLSISRSTAS
jgi:AcrR family transcriptional regulator